jgi:hypothetical protein
MENSIEIVTPTDDVDRAPHGSLGGSLCCFNGGNFLSGLCRRSRTKRSGSITRVVPEERKASA